MGQIHQIHDKFFKCSLKEKAIAKTFLKTYLPADLYQRLNLDTLELTDKSLVLPQLKEIHSDVVYRCEIDEQDGYIVFLMDHQSTPDKWLPFRHLQYKVGLMADAIKRGDETLPVVITICVYHGKESPYPHSMDIGTLFRNPDEGRASVIAPAYFVDLTVMPDEQIQQHGVLALMESLFKHVWARDFVQALKRILRQGLLAQAMVQASPTYLEAVLDYIYGSGGSRRARSVDALTHLLMDALPDKRRDIMTFAEQLEQRGREKGRQEGRQEGWQEGKKEEARAIAQSMLLKGLDLSLIKEVTRLSEKEIIALMH